MAEFPTPEQVATEWLRTVPGVDPTKVATSLPGDAAVWAASGFWTVTVVGGGVDPHLPVFAPVVTVSSWAANLNSSRPPWGRAGSMAGRVVWATYGAPGTRPTQPVLDEVFVPARLMQAEALGMPQRVQSDEGGFARVDVDVQLTYTLRAVPA